MSAAREKQIEYLASKIVQLLEPGEAIASQNLDVKRLDDRRSTRLQFTFHNRTLADRVAPIQDEEYEQSP